MGKKEILNILKLVVLSLFVASCIPKGSEKKSADCASSDYEFDPVSRTCKLTAAAQAPKRLPPVPTTTSATITEDTTPNIPISYTDVDGDLATSCNVTTYDINLINPPLAAPVCTCSAGSCYITLTPLTDFNGPASLSYTVTDANDGTSIAKDLLITVLDSNDAPTVTPVGTYNVDLAEDQVGTTDMAEPQTAGTSPTTATFNLCTEITNEGGVVDDVDSVDNVTLQIITAPTLGTLSCNTCDCINAAASCSCSYTFDAANVNGAAYTTFNFRFVDTPPNGTDPALNSANITMQINIDSRNDAPATISDFTPAESPLSEDALGSVLTLNPSSDVEDGVLIYEIAKMADICPASPTPCVGTIEYINKHYGTLYSSSAPGDPTCLDLEINGDVDPTPSTDGLKCLFDPYFNMNASNITFYYRARDLNTPTAATTPWTTVTFDVSAVNDLPLPFYGFAKFSESKTALASDGETFTFDLGTSGLDIDAYDYDGDTVSYSNSSNPTDATVIDCMGVGSATVTDVDCTLSMDDDNGNKNTTITPIKASGTTSYSSDELTFTAKYHGSAGNSIVVEIKAEDNRARNHPIPTDLGCASGVGLVYATCPDYFDHMVEVSTDGTTVNIDVYTQSTHYTTDREDVMYLLNDHPVASKYIDVTGGVDGAVASAGIVPLLGGLDSDASFVYEYEVDDGSGFGPQPLKGYISLEITPTNDTPVFCRYSPYEDAPECGLLGCIGHETPTKKGITPSSHTDERPIYFYDSSKASCFRSTGTVDENNWEVVTYTCAFSTSNPDCGGGDCTAAGSPVGLVTPSTHGTAPVIYQDSDSKACYKSTGTSSSDWEMISAGIPEIFINEGDVVRLDRIVMDEGGGSVEEDDQQLRISAFNSTNTVLLNLNNVDLKETIDNRFIPCNFSKVDDENLLACDGTSDCNESTLGFADPDGNVVPSGHSSSDPIFYWANLSPGRKCYVSTGTTSNDWVELVDNTQSFTETTIAATSLQSAAGDTVGTAFAGDSSDDDTYVLEFTPTNTQNGSSIISFNIDDGECQFSTSTETADCAAIGIGGDCTKAGSPNFNGVIPSSHTNSNPVIWFDTGGTCYKSTGTGASDWTTTANNAWPITTVYFKVTVNPVGASHAGWKNLSATGPIINKYDEVKSANASFCPYSKSKCNNGEACIGTSDPGTGPFTNPSVKADADYVVYYNSSADKCFFWDATLAQTNKWTEFTNYCNITQSEYATECFNGSCIFEKNQFATDLATDLVPTDVDNYYVEYDSNLDTFTCYQSTGLNATEVRSYKATASVKLEWENFNVVGSGSLTGYNVYRRLAGEEFDYERPINQNAISSLATSYEDNAENSQEAPVPGTVYYYEVQPIISNVRTRTDESYSVARILAPDPNMTFVHRRIVNKHMCNLMGKFDTDLDQTNANVCDYAGPGSTAGKYDIGTDFLVSTFEAGCPYTADYSSCNTSDGNCIADRNPDNSLDNGEFFYSRNDGKCWYKDGATWEELNTSGNDGDLTGLASMKNILKSELPPLAFFSQLNAHRFCIDSSMDRTDYIPGCPFSRTACGGSECVGNSSPNNIITPTVNGVYFWEPDDKRCYLHDGGGTDDWTQVGGDNNNSIPMRLPSRKEQIAFSFWDNNNLNDSTIVVFEQGLSLNSSSKCNSSSASGLLSGYTDSEAPDSNSLYSLPGTSTSGIRSVATGVSETENCQSFSGARDLIGNLSEWTSDRVNCESDYTCKYQLAAENPLISHNDFTVAGSQIDNGFLSGSGANGAFVFGWYDGDSSGSLDAHLTDGFPMGPCIDTDNDDICDESFFGSWTIDTEANGAGRFIIPLGLPANVDFPSNYPADPAVDAFFEIGPTSGITANQLHDDTVVINSDTNGIKHIAGGGSYLTGTGSGQWHFEFVDDAAETRVDVGFRCVMPIDNNFYTE